MSNIANLIKEQAQAATMRVSALKLGHDIAEELGCKFYPSAHFLDRFNTRMPSPIKAVRALEISLRVLRINKDKIKDKHVAVLAQQHVFIYDCRRNRIAACTFWWTDRPASVALAGRGDLLLECQ